MCVLTNGGRSRAMKLFSNLCRTFSRIVTAVVKQAIIRGKIRTCIEMRLSRSTLMFQFNFVFIYIRCHFNLVRNIELYILFLKVFLYATPSTRAYFCCVGKYLHLTFYIPPQKSCATLHTSIKNF